MRSLNKILAVLTLVTTLTISDFPFIQNPKAWALLKLGGLDLPGGLRPALLTRPKIQNSQVLAQSPDARKAEADRLFQQGIEQSETRQFETALQSWQQAMIIYREIKDRQGEAWSLRNLGLAYRSLEDYPKAIEYFQQSLAIAHEIKDRQGEVWILRFLGKAYQHLGDYAKAIEYFQQSLVIAREIEDFGLESVLPYDIAEAQSKSNPRIAEADRLRNQGNQQYQTNQVEAALQSWQQALSIYRETKERQGEGMMLRDLGNTYDSLGDYPKAIEYHQQYLAVARETQDRLSEGFALLYLSNSHANQGIQQFQNSQFEAAIQSWQQALSIDQEIKNGRDKGWTPENIGLAAALIGKGEGWILANLGAGYLKLGDYAKAIEYSQQSLAIARANGDLQREGQVLGNLGVAYLNLGDYRKVIEYSQQSLAIARQIQDPQIQGRALLNLGAAYNNLGDYPKGIEYSQQSLAIAREIKDPQTEGQALGNLGLAYLNLGDYSKAIEYYEQHLAIAREIKDRQSEGIALLNLGDAYRNLADYPKAIEYFQQSLAIARQIDDPQIEGRTLGGMGLAYRNLGDYPKAIEYSQQHLAIAHSIQERQSEGVALGNIGAAYLNLGDYPKAIEFFRQHLAIARAIQDRQSEGIAQNNLGYALYKQGNLALAESNLIEGIKVLESLRAGLDDSKKVSILETQRSTYVILQKVLVAQNKTSSALEIAERGRARAFVELLARRNTTTSDSPNSPITPPTIERLQQIAKQQNATLVEYSIIPDNFKINGKQELRESELYIWVIKPTGEVTFRKADLKSLRQQQNTSLAELVINSRKSINVRNRSEPATVVVELSPQAQQRQLAQQRQKLQQLHQLLIEPIANLLPTDPQARVIFIPQEELFLVPFPALVDASGRYLIEKHTLLTAPSIEVLGLTRQQRQQIKSSVSNPVPSNVLIAGNPLMPRVWNPNNGKEEQLSYLEGAEREAQAIADFFSVPVLLYEQATERAIKQQISHAQIVHLATHGLLDYGTPEDTGLRDFPGAIALAPGEGEDGLLTSAEIVDLNLKAELVALSACDTGRGRIRSEGVIGLSRSLILAGVPSVLVSLWAVDDAATTELMQEFYKQWQQNPDKAQALRQAMLTTMQKHPDPKLWAAFTLIGEAE
jgi:CHAT domain-containing protein